MIRRIITVVMLCLILSATCYAEGSGRIQINERYWGIWQHIEGSDNYAVITPYRITVINPNGHFECLKIYNVIGTGKKNGKSDTYTYMPQGAAAPFEVYLEINKGRLQLNANFYKKIAKYTDKTDPNYFDKFVGTWVTEWSVLEIDDNTIRERFKSEPETIDEYKILKLNLDGVLVKATLKRELLLMKNEPTDWHLRLKEVYHNEPPMQEFLCIVNNKLIIGPNIYTRVGANNYKTNNNMDTPISNEIKLIINGNILTLEVPPVVEDGRTLVPARALLESLGWSMEWIAEKQTVKATKDGKIIMMSIDSTKASVNGNQVILDVPAKVINGRTVVPARFIAEATGAKVDWNSTTREVTITALGTDTTTVK